MHPSPFLVLSFFLVWDLERDLLVVDLVFIDDLDFLLDLDLADLIELERFFFTTLFFEFDLDLLLDLDLSLRGLLDFFFLEAELLVDLDPFLNFFLLADFFKLSANAYSSLRWDLSRSLALQAIFSMR